MNDKEMINEIKQDFKMHEEKHKQIEENTPVIPLGYEIYLQDLSKPYIELEKLGYAKTISEAQNCVKLLRESLLTANERKVQVGRNLNNCTILFRAVLKE